jgi:D-alanyl-D-alanine endopeptidase (penicillin-binding protein 7)
MRVFHKLIGLMLAGGVSLAAGFIPTVGAETAVSTLSHVLPGLPPSLLEPSYQRRLQLKSVSALVIDELTGTPLYASHASTTTPIASLTKLMTAMVVLDAKLPLDEKLTVTRADVDRMRGTHSRLREGVALSRQQMLNLALMSSENRAAATLARTYPGGKAACIAAMNRKAKALGLRHTTFADGTGLDADNVSTADDLAKLVRAAHGYKLIKQFTTTASQRLSIPHRAEPLEYKNTNILVRKSIWDIGLSKTGYISESGRCLVMHARISGRPMIIVLLNSQGKYSGIGDANRIRKWIEGAARSQG